MEVVQVQPRDSYLHYVYVPIKNTAIVWSFTTKRNNIQFGVYKRHGQEPLPSSSEILFRAQAHRQGSLPAGELLNAQAPLLTMDYAKELLTSSAGSIHSANSSATSRPRAKSVASTKLREQGLTEIVPIQQTNSSQAKIEGSLVVTEPGNYVLVFDNTFSRNTPKLLTLSVTLSETPSGGLNKDSLGGGIDSSTVINGSSANQYELTGWLLKKRRKKMQGWAKRWFRLSASGVLSYSTSPTGVPRGFIQIRISTITNQPKSRALHIDSGTMIYHLKALTPEDHEVWTKHLKKHRASGLETEVESFEEWRHKRQSRHVSAIAKEKAKVDVSRGLQGSQYVKEKLQCLDQWIKEQKDHYADNQPDWIVRLVQLTEDLEVAIDRQDQQWHVIQETVIQADPFGQNKTSGTSTPLSTIADTNTDSIDPSSPVSGMAGLRRTATMLSHNSSFSEEFYDAEDIELSPSEEDNDGDGDVHIEETADTTDDDEEEEEEEEDLSPEHQEEDFGSERHQETKDWTQQWLDCPHRRHRLPSPAVGDVGSALSVFRKNVGKDLSTIAMPVSMNEPLNMLQKACEELEYSELLDKACTLTTPMERLMYITIFAITSYTSSQYRTGRKPFNPMMTETYENIRPDRGFRFIAEKVSHNPLIIAAHAESKNYKYWQCTKIKSKFWGKSMEFMTEGVFHVNLTGHDDHFTYAKPSSWMRNMIAGEKYLEHAGEMKVMNHTTGEYATVTFKEGTGGGLFGAPTNRNDVVATFYSASGKKVRRIVGKWSDKLAEEVDMNKRQLSVLWTANTPGVEDHAKYYGFTRFCMELNEITDIEKDKLPITDTRYRPDQHLYELGNVDEADTEKQRIEQKQRDRRKDLELKGIPWEPRWFKLQEDPYNDPGFVSPDSVVGQSWVFDDQYWTTRESGKWPQDLFELW